MQIDDEDVSKTDVLVSLLSNTGKSEFRGGVYPITARLPLHQMSVIRAMSKHSGMSVNKTIMELLDVAIDVAYRALPKKDAKAIHSIQSEIASEMLAAGHPEQAYL